MVSSPRSGRAGSLQMANGSDTMSPTLRRGLSEEIGSWKIICIRVRMWRRSSPCRAVSSSPSKVTLPAGRDWGTA